MKLSEISYWKASSIDYPQQLFNKALKAYEIEYGLVINSMN